MFFNYFLKLSVNATHIVKFPDSHDYRWDLRQCQQSLQIQSNTTPPPEQICLKTYTS